MLVQKFNGSLQELDVNKINKWVSYSTRNATRIEWSAIVGQAHLKLYDGMPTSQITLALCDACEVLANTAANEDKNYIAAKEYLDAGQELYIPYMLKVAFNTKKSLFGDVEPLGKILKLSDETTLEYRNYSLYQTIQLGISLGKYDKDFALLSESLINKCEDLIDYSRMYNHPLCGLKQLASKYVIKHKKTPFENPQEAFMLISIALAFSDASNGGNTIESIPYSTKWFVDTVQYYYHYVSNGLTNLPTPSMAGIRSPLKQFASCTLFPVGDNLTSISQAYDIASKATAARAGLGMGLGAIRALGSMIRGGEVTHTGLIPFLKVLSGISKSCTQNGVRGGGGTVNLPIWHRDFFDLVMLKDISGIEGENRLRQLDYAFHYNIDQLIQLMEDGNLLLMSPHTKFKDKTIYDWFYNVDENGMYDPSTFNEYCKLRLADPTLKHYKDPTLGNGDECYVSAYDVFDALATQMIQTSRMYTFIVDNVNNHSAFLERVEMTNLCVEILQPVFAYDDARKWMRPEVSLCTLGGIPWGKIKLEDMEHVCMAQLRILNSKLHIMKGSVIPHTDDSMRRMNVGIGAIDVFHMLAKEVFSKFPKDQWIQESARVTHTWMEHMQFYLLKAAVELAKQYGACEWFHKTKYSKGILPIDTYTKSKYVDFPLTRDWEGLRKDIIEYGMRFSLVTAHMPSESSSVVWGFLNSSEPPKAAVIVKGSKSTQVTMMCPELDLYGDVYPYVWDDHPFDINDLYFSIAVNLAKFSDQGISYNTYINYQKTPRLDQKYLFRILFARPALCGIKTTYYVNNNVDSDSSDLVKQQAQVEVEETQEQIDEDVDDGGCAGGFCTL